MAGACLARLCCSRSLRIASVSDDVEWDVVSATASSWWDPTGATPYDKVIVQLISLPEVSEDVLVEVCNGGCSKSSKMAFKKGGSKRIALLMHSRANCCTKLTVTVGTGEMQVPLPAADAGWVTSSVHGVELRLRAELAETKVVPLEQYFSLGMLRHTIAIPPAQADGAPGGERAVLTYKLREGNAKMLLWLPGRNDCFFHPHVLPAILDAGYDLYCIDHRRNGISQEDASVKAKQLTSHVRVQELELERTHTPRTHTATHTLHRLRLHAPCTHLGAGVGELGHCYSS